MNNKRLLDNLIIFAISFLVVFVFILPLLNKDFPRTHDTNLYMTWLYEFDQGFRDGNFLPRWSANLWIGFGSPLFNFIQPFFYYMAQGFHLFGFSLVNSVKIVIALSVIFSFLFMFLLAKKFWGKWSALVIATLYIYLPYRIGLLYIRGDFSEYLATAWFPLILFSFHKFLKTEKPSYFLLSSFSIALLFLTHNIQTVLFLPVLIIYIIIFNWKQITKILKSALAIIYGALLAGFFWIPAFFERKYIQIERLTTGRYDFHNHFIGLKKLFLPFWGGADFYQIGAISILIIIFTIYVIIKCKKNDFNTKHLIFFLTLIIFCLFLTTKASTFLWENVPLMSYAQFPWRSLSLVAFGLTILCSVITFPEFYRIFTKKEINKNFFIILTLFIFVFSLTLFIIRSPAKPMMYIPSREDFQYSAYYQLLDEINIINKERKEDSQINVYSIIPDILPKWTDAQLAREKFDELALSLIHTVLEKEKSFFIDKLILVSGKATILESKILSSKYQFIIDVKSEAKFRINTFWFPSWHAYVDGKEAIIDKNNPLGLIDINIPEGKHILRVEFHNTPLRNVAAYISLASFLIFLLISLVLLIKKFFVRKQYAN